MSNFWFAKVDVDVATDKSLSITARFIFTILCTFADDKRGCWPSNEAVAEAAGVSQRTVIRAYKELEARGVIARDRRFKNNQQTTSYTLIVGYNAPCYGGVIDDRAGVSPESYRTRTNEQESKDSLTGEALLPDCPIVFENDQPVTHENPEETHTPDEAPNIMKQTAEYLLLKTGRSGLSWEEISALRTLSATQYPNRVQREIDKAISRFNRKCRPLNTLTFMYTAASLEHQPTLGRKRKAKPKPVPVPVCTDEQAEAMMAEIEAMQAEFDREAGR